MQEIKWHVEITLFDYKHQLYFANLTNYELIRVTAYIILQRSI
jgi:hypothetical protein